MTEHRYETPVAIAEVKADFSVSCFAWRYEAEAIEIAAANPTMTPETPAISVEPVTPKNPGVRSRDLHDCVGESEATKPI